MITDHTPPADNASDRRRADDPRAEVWEKLADGDTEYREPARCVECGWGRVLFAQTFASTEELVDTLREEKEHRRDVAFYVHDPHVLVAHAPQELFLDPSHTFRADLTRVGGEQEPPGALAIERAETRSALAEVDAILRRQAMVPLSIDDFLDCGQARRGVTWFVARQRDSGRALGTVMGIDHHAAFGDPEHGSSLWALAADPDAAIPGVGVALVQHLLHVYARAGARYLDLSVVHENETAIRLYEDLGFRRVPIFCVKRKNPFNEPLFASSDLPELNPYADLIVREALRRGIHVEVVDQPAALFKLTHGGRTIACRESLSELTTAVAMTRCADKTLTNRLLARAGFQVPAQRLAGDAEDNRAFLEEHERIVVKPIDGEQGHGVHVGLETAGEVEAAVSTLRGNGSEPILEQMVAGDDLRVVVIGGAVVAAALRKPARVIGTGEHTVEQLIRHQSRRRAAATGGESRIPLDGETRAQVARLGYAMDSVLPEGVELVVRRTANLHTGGTLHDVTDVLHPRIAMACEEMSEVLDIPVVGLDLMVESPEQPDYWVIEANERPGLANHEPQPTAERFIELLFPATIKTRRDRAS